MPLSDFVLDGFPNCVSQVEVPVIFFDVNDAIKWWALFALIVEDAWVSDAIIQFLILASGNVDNETEFDIDNCFDFGGYFGNFWQGSRV